MTSQAIHSKPAVGVQSRVINSLKRLKWYSAQVGANFQDAWYDLARYLKYSNAVQHADDDPQKLEGLLYFYYHKIEKSLALPQVKAVFGLGYIDTLINLLEQWIQLTHNPEAVVYRGALAALTSYDQQVGPALAQENPRLAQRVKQFLGEAGGEASFLGGVLPLSAEALRPHLRAEDFACFVEQRRSVRNFSQQRVSDLSIQEAVRVAKQSPSVCNRQCWRVHVYTTEEDKTRVLQYQNGNEGFGHLADRILLITADLRVFLTSGERNQAYTDTGMFAMSLVYALHAQGIASCCLNLGLTGKGERALREVCDLPQEEAPVMMIAIGYPAPELRVAISARKPTESLLTFENLNKKSVG